MANVIYLQPVPYNESLAPGQESEWWLGPMDAYRHSTIMVTAHAYEPLYEDTMMSVQQVKVEEKPNASADVIIWVTVRNTGAVTIRSWFLHISTIGA